MLNNKLSQLSHRFLVFVHSTGINSESVGHSLDLDMSRGSRACGHELIARNLLLWRTECQTCTERFVLHHVTSWFKKVLIKL